VGETWGNKGISLLGSLAKGVERQPGKNQRKEGDNKSFEKEVGERQKMLSRDHLVTQTEFINKMPFENGRKACASVAEWAENV